MTMATTALFVQQEERILWDLQQIVAELERIPGALLLMSMDCEEVVVVEDPLATSGSSHHHRRALRRLDRVLEQLEKNASTTSSSLFVSTSFSKEEKSMSTSSRNGRDQQQPDPDPESLSSPSSFSLQVQELLLLLLTRLEIPRIHSSPNNNNNSNQETTPALLLGQLVACCLERIGAIMWGIAGGETFWLLPPLPDNTVVALLRRLIQCRDGLFDSNNTFHINHNVFVWKAALLWLSVLNQQFHVLLESHHQQQSEPSPQSVPSQQSQSQQSQLPDQNQNQNASNSATRIWQQPWFLVPTVAEFLRTALDMLTNNSNNNAPSVQEEVENVVTETRFQWGILTGYLWTWLVRHHQLEQQQQQHDHNMDVPRWLCQALHQAEPNLAHTVVTHTVQNILHTLLTYVSELTNHALDALDEAAVAFQSSTYNNIHSNDDNDDANQPQRIEAWIAAECAVQDSLRQVALVMQLLQTLQPWCGCCHNDNADRFTARLAALRQQQLVHLWVTVAPAFLERSHVTTALNYKQQQQQNLGNDAQRSWDNEEDKDQDLGYRLCHLRLQLAEMVLSSSSLSSSQANTMSQGNMTATTTTTTAGHTDNTDNNYETSLCLTFLRGLEYPELLGMADTLWHELERRLSRDDHRDLQQMLRAAVLTLRKQYLLPVVAIVGPGHALEHHPEQQSRHQRQRAGAHAIVQRLLPLLVLWTATTKDPWDGFFWRQSAGLIVNNHHHSEGE